MRPPDGHTMAWVLALKEILQHMHSFSRSAIHPHVSSGPLNAVTRSTGTFELVVLGKNGVTVEGEPILPGMPPVPLISGTLITICDTSFWFLLPRRGTTAGAESKKRSR